MTIPTYTFASFAAGNFPAADWDVSWAEVSALTNIFCTAAGTNSIALTPSATSPNPAAYQSGMKLTFLATGTNTGAVTIHFSLLAALPLYDQNGLAVSVAGTITSGTYYEIAYDATLNSNAGGFRLLGVNSGAALTKVDDTNVTLTLTGTPANALVTAAGITVGWSGTLAAGRLNANVVQGVTNDTNITGTISAQNLTFAWSGSLSAARGGTGQTTYTKGDLLATPGGATLNKLPVGADGTALTADAASTNGVKWTALTGTGTVTSVATAGLATGGTITTTGTVTVTAATKSDQQTGTSTTTVVTPAHQQDHDSAAKAWVNFTGSSGAVNASYNVPSVTRTGAGRYTVNFTNSFATANYAALVTAIDNGTVLISQALALSAGSFTVAISNTASTPTDPAQVAVVCFGRQ